MWEPVALAVSPQVGAEVLVVVGENGPGGRITVKKVIRFSNEKTFE